MCKKLQGLPFPGQLKKLVKLSNFGNIQSSCLSRCYIIKDEALKNLKNIFFSSIPMPNTAVGDNSGVLNLDCIFFRIRFFSVIQIAAYFIVFQNYQLEIPSKKIYLTFTRCANLVFVLIVSLLVLWNAENCSDKHWVNDFFLFAYCRARALPLLVPSIVTYVRCSISLAENVCPQFTSNISQCCNWRFKGNQMAFVSLKNSGTNK